MFKTQTDLTNIQKITISGLVIALYVVVMFLTQSFAFGQYQVRIATSIYGLSAIYPFLIVPLGLANFLSNTLMGGLGILDILGGFIVGLLTAYFCYKLRKVNVYLVGLPILIIPTLCVPIWLSYLLNIPYIALVVSIGIGQIIPAVLAVLLVKYLEKRRKEIK